jgi:peptide/nickel transport system ATP-binding protein
MKSANQAKKRLLDVEDLSVEFDTRQGVARVINDLRLFLDPGETLGIVGESGCGKSMTALAIMGLVPRPPGRITSGRILLKGEDLLAASENRMCQVRGKDISMIFQEPMTSLNPVFTVGNQIAEAVRLHEGLDKKAAHDRAVEMLRQVDIPEPKKRVNEYPYQLSGGMRQRIMIAMALVCSPRVLIADEPTTALDVTVQAQIFDLLKEIQKRTGTSIIFITHDMASIAEMTNRVVVMYAGHKVEDGPVEKILIEPRHPYTKALISCVPHLESNPSEQRPSLTEIPGMVPSLIMLGRGCPFAPRCNQAMSRCTKEMPPEFDIGPDHTAACWLEDGGEVA